jgi:hypothetical protein
MSKTQPKRLFSLSRPPSVGTSRFMSAGRRLDVERVECLNEETRA